VLRYLRSVLASLLFAAQAFAATPCPTISIGPVGQLPSGAQQIPYNATFTASGSAATPVGFQITSGLPTGSGLSINPSTGVLSGTPTLDGQFLLTVTGTDQNGCSGGRTYAVDIRPAVLDTVPANGASGVAATATIKIDFTESVTASAGAFSLQCPSGTPIAFTVSPALPANASSFTLTPNANLPQNVVCTSTVAAAQIKATNPPKLKPASDYTFTFSTGSLPTITSANATTFTVGTPGTFTVTTTGTPAPSITRGGVALPANLSFTDNGNGTGTLSGTPVAGMGGTYAITFTANNTSGSSPTQNFTLTVNEAPTITSANATSFAVGAAGTFSVTTTGFPKPTITRGGVALPSNVTFTDNGNGTGTLAGTPASGTGGTYPITFTATNGIGSPANQNFNFSVVGATSSTALALTTGTNPSVYGQSLAFTATVTGTGPTPTGTVTFKDGATTLGTGSLNGSAQATFSTTTLGAGAHSITAVYGGDGNFATSTSAPLSQTVNQSSTFTSLSTSKDPVVHGEAVTFTSIVVAAAPGSGIPTGAVTFIDTTTATTLGTGSLNASGQATLTTSALTTGAHTITANYGGDTNFATSSTTNGQTVNQANTTTTLATSKSPTVSGEQVTFTATVAPVAPGAGTPTGTVTFQDAGNPIGTGSLNGGGQATYTTSALTVSSHTITAVYVGDSNFVMSTSGPLTQTVNQAVTTTTLTSNNNPSTINQSVTLTATVAAVAPGAGIPSGTVTFTDTTTSTTLGTVPLNPSAQAALTTAALGAGAHAITATYNGDASFTTSTGSLTQTVNLNASTTTLASSPNPSVFGQTVTLTATVTGAAGTPTGTIQFMSDASPFGLPVTLNGSGQASITASGFSTGSHTLTAVYSGDSIYGGSTSAPPVTQVVNQDGTNITVSSGTPATVYGQSATFTATVTAQAPGSGVPTGTVTFLDNGTPMGSGTLVAGTATFTTTTLAVGPHSITATYGGDTNFLTSTTSVPATQTVAPDLTNTTVSGTPNPSLFGAPVLFTATVTAGPPGSGTPTGLVTFFADASPIGTGVLNPSGQATLSYAGLGVGGHAITATYGGDSNFTGSSSAITPQTVSQDSTMTVVGADVDPSSYGQTVTFTATVSANPPGSGTPTGTVTFVDTTTATTLGTQPLAGNTATLATSALTGGSHSILATYSGDPNFLTSSGGLTQTVNASGTSTTVASSANPAVIGETVTFTATVTPTSGSAVPTGTVTFTDNGTPLGSPTLDGTGQATFTTSTLTLGDHPIVAAYSGDTNYTSSLSGTLTQTINQADTTTTVTSDVPSSTFGQLVTFTITVAAQAPGSGTPTGTVDLKDDTTTLATGLTLDGSGQATFAISTLSVGSHPKINATYSGDTNYKPSDNVASPYTQTVNIANTTTTVNTSGSPSVFGQNVTFTATVAAQAPGAGTPAGTVTFKDGATSLGTGTLAAGTATFSTTSLGVSSHTITAVYAGSSNYATSTSAGITQIVNKAGTSTAVTSDLNPSKTGDNVTFTATISVTAPGAGTPTGTVTFKDGATTLGTGSVAGGTATFSTTTLPVGARSITAVYGGDTNFNGSTSSALTQNVNQPPSITSGNATTFNPGVAGTFTVNTTGFPTNASMNISTPGPLPSGVNFVNNNNGTATLSGTPGPNTQNSSPYGFTITADNGVAPAATQGYTLTVQCLAISISGSIPNQIYNTAMSTATFGQTNGHGTITWSATGLPSGLAINSSNGQVTGTPTQTGTFTPTITATDFYGCAGSSSGLSFTVAPKLVADSYSVVGNTQLVVAGASSPGTPFTTNATTILNNDQSDTTITLTTGTFATTGGGSVTINGTGGLTYTPPAGQSAGTDTYTYTGTSNGVSATATITFNIANIVWFVDNSSVGTHDGRSNTPFTNMGSGANGLGTALAGTGPAVNAFIYVSKGAGNTTGNYTFKSSQTLLGAGATLTVGALSVTGNLANTPTLSGTLTVANSTTIDGIDMSTTTLTALNNSAATTGLSIHVRNLTTTSGTGVSMTTTGNTGNITIDSLTVGAAPNAIVLGSLVGTLTVGAASVTNNTGAAFSLGGVTTANLSNAGATTISSNAAGGSGLVLNATALNIVNGNLAYSNSSSATGVSMTGGTVSIAVGTNTFSVTNTSSGAGIVATAGGTFTITGSANTISTQTGTALNVANTTIGAGGLTFRSISSGSAVNSAPNGIILDTTGANAGLTVTGTGAAGTGGTIQHKTGADGSTSQGSGIYLNSTQKPSFSWMQLNDFQNYGIVGTNVTGLTLDHVVINGTNGTSVSGIGEGDAYFTGLSGSAAAPVTVSSSTFVGAFADAFHVFNNSSQTLNRITITGSTFATVNGAGNTSNDALVFQATGGTMNVTVQSSSMTSARSDLFQLNLLGTVTSDLVFGGAGVGNTLSNNNANIVSGGGGVTIGGGGPTNNVTLTYNISHNTISGSHGAVIALSKGTGVGASFTGTIDSNTIGTQGVFGSGSTQGEGIAVFHDGAGLSTTTITNNHVSGVVAGRGAIDVYVHNGGGGKMVATVQGNVIDTLDQTNSFAGMYLQTGSNTVSSGSPDNNKSCLTIGGGTAALKNTVDVSPNAAGFIATGITVEQEGTSQVGLLGSPNYGGTAYNDAAVQTYVGGNNTQTGPNASPVFALHDGAQPAGDGFLGVCP